MVGETVLVLILGAALLAAGSLSMLAVRLAGTGLRGIGWFSASFAAGSCAAAFLLVNGAFANTFLADAALLVSFYLLQIAVTQLTPRSPVVLWHGCLPVAFQWLVDAGCQFHFLAPRMRIVAVGLLVAWQTATTAYALWPVARGPLRIPALFLLAVLSSFSGFNVLRSTLALTDGLTLQVTGILNLVAFCLYLAVAMGLAFGFFWMTTTKLMAEVEYNASTDPLTRVYNRRHFLKWCEKELLRSQRSGTPFSVLMVDLDHFKCVNDNFGHHRGDEVLVAAVERMQDSVRGIDVLCRWGGEEFAVLLPSAPQESTRIVAERIRENVARMNVSLGSCPQEEEEVPRLTVSIGAATYRDLDDDVAAMLLRADRALYRAKQTGRNRVLLGA